MTQIPVLNRVSRARLACELFALFACAQRIVASNNNQLKPDLCRRHARLATATHTGRAQCYRTPPCAMLR